MKCRFLGLSQSSKSHSGDGTRNLGFWKPTGDPRLLAADWGPPGYTADLRGFAGPAEPE